MSKGVVMATWDDVPHLTAEAKAEMLASYPPYQRDARSRGVPQLGAGAIYPVPESEVSVAPFPIPHHWPRGFGLDVGWKKTAAVFVAHDRETDCLYVYDLHYRGQVEPSTHAAAIRARGAWMVGVIDPAARGRSQKDGEQLIRAYNELGCRVIAANNAVETGLLECWQRMVTGRLKVFAHLADWWTEYRLYRRDEKGNIVKVMDHAMDATRYHVMSGIPLMSLDPEYLKKMGFKPTITNEYDPYDEGRM